MNSLTKQKLLFFLKHIICSEIEININSHTSWPYHLHFIWLMYCCIRFILGPSYPTKWLEREIGESDKNQHAIEILSRHKPGVVVVLCQNISAFNNPIEQQFLFTQSKLCHTLTFHMQHCGDPDVKGTCLFSKNPSKNHIIILYIFH